MPKILLRGYLMECGGTALRMENALLEAMENAVNTANKAYRRLVAWQAERIADEVALGCYRCPEGASVFSVAVNEVGLRIACAIQNAHHTEFNFHIEGKILIVENDGKEKAYLSVDTLNEAYLKGLDRARSLTRYDITEADLAAGKAKAALWHGLCGKYRDGAPLGCSLVNLNALSVEPGHLKFRSPLQRARDIAEEKVMNHLLSCYGRNQDIPPAKLMEYVMFARKRIAYADMQEAVESETEALAKILPELTTELILSGGQAG